MSSASRYLYRSFSRISSQIPAKQSCRIHSSKNSRSRIPVFNRQFTSGTRCYADSNAKSTSKNDTIPEISEAEYQAPAQPYTVADLDPAERATFETLSKPDQQRYMRLQNHAKAILESQEGMEGFEKDADKLAREIDRESPEIDYRETRNVKALNAGFWAEDEDDEFGQVEDDDDEVSDEHITSVAESELELQREIREYYRITAWELPLLEKFSHPFTPPTKEQVLMFRYTTYMGEEHPAAKKVVCEFKVNDLAATAGLTASQKRKLTLLAGVRYNPDKDLVKLSCEKFENAAQNKRYLGELVQKLISEAKNSSDMFEDVPLDIRHVKEKPKVKFPKEWFMNDPEKVQRLVEARQKSTLLGQIAPASLPGPATENTEAFEGEREPVPVVNGRVLVGRYVRGKSAVNAVTR